MFSNRWLAVLFIGLVVFGFVMAGLVHYYVLTYNSGRSIKGPNEVSTSTKKTVLTPTIRRNDWDGWKWYPLSTFFRPDPLKADPHSYEDYYNFYRNIDGSVYYLPGDATEMQKLWEADSHTFEFAFVEQTPIEGAATSGSFKGGVGLKYAKDKHYVYWKYFLLPEANPATFTPIFDSHGNLTYFSKDDKHVYYQSKLIVGADPNSFVVEPSDYATPYSISASARDKSNTYAEDKLLP